MLESTVPLEVIHSDATIETPVIPPPPPEPPPSSLTTSDKQHHHQVLRESRHVRKLTAVINFHIRLGHAPIRAMKTYLACCINDLGITQADCDLLPDCASLSSRNQGDRRVASKGDHHKNSARAATAQYRLLQKYEQTSFQLYSALFPCDPRAQ